MATIIHFIDVGQGNMVLIETADGNNFVFDCNITDENEKRVLDYVAAQIGVGQSLHAFICSHRDADHIRGIKKLHARFPISCVWDSDCPGTTTNTPEYRDYMDLRRRVGSEIRKRLTYTDFGKTRFNYLSAQDERLPDNANAQGIVIKVEDRSSNDKKKFPSAMLPGDSDSLTWQKGIMIDYNESDVSSSIFMAAHHGSISFFGDSNDKYYYTDHISTINPDMTIVSVGNNSHGHPDQKAIDLYEKYSNGSKQGNKILRTDKKGNIKTNIER